MNIQHSSRTDRWYTPLYIIEMVKEVLGEIDLDPASEEHANEVIGAREFYTRNALNGNQSQSALFWEKLVYHFGRGHIGEAIFMAFSAELLAVSQKYGPKSLLDFTVCVPKNRIRFVDPLSPGKSAPSHSNVIVYLGDNPDKFKQVFSRIGACK
jgi:hypothetical protein